MNIAFQSLFSLTRVAVMLLICVSFLFAIAGHVAHANEGVVTITLDQRGTLAEDRATKLFGGAGKYLPSGIYKKAGEPIVITVSATDQKANPRVVISDPILEHYVDGNQDGIPLQEGRNVISVPKAGIVHLINESNETSIPPTVTIEGGQKFALFVLGQHTLEDWHDMLAQYKDIPAIELVGERVLITASYDVAKGLDDPVRLLESMDEAIDVINRVSGLDEYDPNPIHRPSKFRQHMRESPDGWMYMFLNHTGYHTDAMRNVLNADNFRNDFMNYGWGPWHEFGHTYQQSLWKWSGTGEVTTNIYSLSVERHFGNGGQRFRANNAYNEAFQYMDRPNRDYQAFDNLFAKLVMFWQLDLAFGPGFYPTLHRVYREMPEPNRPKNDSEQIQTFISTASEVASRNLTPFFEMWGLEPTQATKERIAGLPELTEPIWRLTDAGYAP